MPVKVQVVSGTAGVPPAMQRAGRPRSQEITINPRFAGRLAALGLTSAEAILDLPGEVVSGHPDRHVVRVELPGWGRALYLKRQHRVGWKERLRQQLAGFGWASRCEREARVIRELEAAGFACPEWVAFGEDDRGRAFLLVEELAGSVELRRLLGDTRLSLDDRRRVAERLGQAVAELHAAGFVTPDLTAKHVFLAPERFAVTLIDWQSARRVPRLGMRERLRSLAALDASLADHLATRAERLRVLWAYTRVTRQCRPSSPPPLWGRSPRSGGWGECSEGLPPTRRAALADLHHKGGGEKSGQDVLPRFSALVNQVARLSASARLRRSVRDQRQPVVTDAAQRLVWLAGEAVCAVPEVAATWPAPAAAPPFYDSPPGRLRIRLADGRPAELVRGSSFAPRGRLAAFLRGRSWRSPGATLGRVLFHLQRYGIPAPQLFAFGQRLTGRATADWFALFEPPAGRPLAEWLAKPAPPAPREEVFEQVGLLLRQLHDAGCRYTGCSPLFWVADAGRVTVGGVRAVRIVKKLTDHIRRLDLNAILGQLPGATHDEQQWVVRGYHRGGGPDRT